MSEDKLERVDVLASLLDIHRFTTAVAGRIDLAPPWRIEGTPTDLLAIHVQVTGRSHVVPQPGAEPVVLDPGDVAIYPHGARGAYIHDGSHPAEATMVLSVPLPHGDATPAPMRASGGQADSSLICCLMQMGLAPRGQLWDALPALIHVRADSLERPNQLSSVVEAMVMESSAPGAAGTRLMSRLSELLLILALRLQVDDETAGPGLRALADARLAPALTLIHAHPGESMSVARLASVCGLSRSAFAAHFATTVGQTPHSYVVDWRMAYAAHVLDTTDLMIDRVAAAVGYHSDAAFRRVFASALGCSPREYRKRRRTGRLAEMS